MPSSLRPVVAACAALVAMTAARPAHAADPGAGPRFAVTFPAERSAAPLDGRLLLLVSTVDDAEPRFLISDRLDTQQVFGVDVSAWAPGAEATVDAAAFGYPRRSLAEVPAGEYTVQALLHRYETFRRADGHVVKLPMDRGEGQQWSMAPGNLYSTPKKVRLDPASPEPVRLALDQEIPPIEPPADSEYVKHLRIESKLLSEFWGRPMHLGAVVVLPHGFAEHPDARYPMAIFHGHFAPTFSGLRADPPEPDLPAVDWDGLRRLCPNGHGPHCKRLGYDRVLQEGGHALWKAWTGPDFPRVLVVQIQHANPYYDDSYAVNSANVGPYGDAITHELIPYLEERFRGLGPWARALYGGSTGGWEALAAQVLYPDAYNGAWASCPDPIDFRAYTLVDLYEDENAYRLAGPWLETLRPGHRDVQGQISVTLEASNHMELALGTRTRSGGQWDVWEAVYSPVGPDGYPKRIWDKETGAIDRAVAAHWREHYDLSHIVARDWQTLGPKLRGKMHVYVGDADNYYLDGAARRFEERLATLTDPPPDAEIRYGDGHEHCWSGDPNHMNAVSRLTYQQRFLPKMVEHWLATAPAGADVRSWRY